MSGRPDEDSAPLRREIGFTGSAFLSFNGIVGAGIFALPATLHLQFGAFSPWLFPIFGLLILLVALPFARLAALFPQSGGPVAYSPASLRSRPMPTSSPSTRPPCGRRSAPERGGRRRS